MIQNVLRSIGGVGNFGVIGSDNLLAIITDDPRQHTAGLIELDPARLTGANTPLVIGVYSEDNLIETVKTVFIGPRPPRSTP